MDFQGATGILFFIDNIEELDFTEEISRTKILLRRQLFARKIVYFHTYGVNGTYILYNASTYYIATALL